MKGFNTCMNSNANNQRQRGRENKALHTQCFFINQTVGYCHLKWSVQQTIKETVKKSAHYLKTSKQNQILP